MGKGRTGSDRGPASAAHAGSPAPAILLLAACIGLALPGEGSADPAPAQADPAVTPFVEIVGRERPLLYDSRRNGATDRPPPRGIAAPVIGLSRHHMLSLEVTVRRPYRGTYFFGWTDKEGRIQRRKPSGYVRVLPYEAAGPLDRETDRFNYLPAHPGATGLSLYYEDHHPEHSPTLDGLDAIRLYGLAAVPVSLDGLVPVERSREGQATRQVLEFPSFVGEELGGPICGVGATITVPDVRALYVMNRDHRPERLKPNEERTLGSLLPQTVIYRVGTGATYALSVSGSELLLVSYEAARKELRIRAYGYHYAERSFIGNLKTAGPSDPASPRHGIRVQNNQSVLERSLPHRLTVTHAPAKGFFFPTWQPSGRLATLVLTEHADYQEADTDALVTFGNRNRKQAPGEGLASNRIPLTKSLFAMGPDTEFSARIKDRTLPFRQVSYEGNRPFRGLIDLYRTLALPFEFGVHTAGTRNYALPDTRKGLEIARTFSSRVWIDHGSVEVNLQRYGWNRSLPEYFLVPALKEFGYTYAWAGHDRKYLGDDHDLNLIQDNEPSQVLFHVPPLDTDAADDWTLWLFASIEPAWSADLFSPRSLERFIRNRALSVLHCYLARDVMTFSTNDKGERTASLASWYNQTLRRLAAERDANRLHLATVGDWASHVRAMKSLTVGGTEAEQVIDNPGGTIRGATFAFAPLDRLSKQPAITLDGRPVTERKVADGVLYLWTDLPPGRHLLSLHN